MKKYVISAILTLFATIIDAQESQTGYNFLRLPVSAHAAALGGDNITLIEDDEALIFHNPALLSSVNDKTVNLNYMNYMSGVNTASASFNRIVNDKASWAVSAQLVDYGKMKETDENNIQMGEFSAKDIAIAGYFSYMLGEKFAGFGNNFAFQAQQVVYAGGAINAGIRLAELGKQQAEVGVKLTRQQARFIALGQYLDLYKIDNRIKVYEKNIELTSQLIADIKAKQTQGMALKNDITRYELQMESLKLGLTSLRNNRSILNHQLLNTLGMNQEDKGEQEMQIIPDATIADKAYAKDGEAYWQTASTMNSPLLEQSSNAIRIAEQKEKIAKSDLLPKVALVAAENFDGPTLFELPPIDKNLNVWYVGVGVKYSLSSLFKSNKRIRQAAVETRQAKESHALQAEQLNNSVQAAYVQYQQTYVELETQRKSVELAQQNYEVMNARYLSQL